ncbi:MAG TPA: HAMP domain-containing sensor histidine kinase [Longimicrobium sp.]|jgi:signal transduction histidine kinase|uniref:sensor histidine kinase n=1 Tax=Longimicrobium sp. TaxID=2029185 RepID=UPI002ED7AC1E
MQSDDVHDDDRNGMTLRISPAALALAFVIISLLTLAVTPMLMIRRLDVLRRDTENTVGRADALVSELRLLLTQEVADHEALRLTSTPAARAHYQLTRRREDSIFQRLLPVAESVDPEVAAHTRHLHALAQRAHVLPDARASGDIDDATFDAELARQRPLRDSVTAARVRLEGALARALENDINRGSRVVRQQRAISAGMGALALCAAVLVGWFARRESALAREVSRALRAERLARKESEQRREELKRISDSKARLMRGFSHDVKNPLGTADGFLQLLEEGILDSVTERQKASIGKARRSLASAVTLIEDLLEIARADTGAIQVSREPTDVARIARDAAEEFRGQAAAQGLALTTEIADGVPTVHSDPVRVRQVLGNLISNAVKYTPAGSVTVRVRACSGPGGRPGVALEVADTGSGIPAEKRHLLFQEYVRFEPSAARGSGVGLAISARIVEALGGEIRVESEPGVGSTFTLWLPVGSRADEQPAPANPRP